MHRAALLRSIAATSIALLWAVAPVRGQLAVDPGVDAAALGLSPQPIVSEAVGVAFYPPRDCFLTTESVNGRSALMLSHNGTSPRWRLRIQPLTSSLPNPSPEAVVEDHLAQGRASGRRFQVLENAPKRLAGVSGQFLLLQETGPDGRETVNGWLVLPMGGPEFVVFTVQSWADELAWLRPQLDASFSTIRTASPELMLSQRRQRIEAADAILNEVFTPDRLRSLVGDRVWYRIHRPDPAAGGADQEIGYMSIQAVEAMRGEVDSSRPPSSLSGDETDRGLMVILQARAILDLEQQRILDVESRFWMAWDRSNEVWSNRSTEKQGKVERSYKQTGVRSAPSTGEPRSTLTVVNDSSAGQSDNAPRRWEVPDKAYLCQPELLYLGALLPRDRGELELAFYAYDSKTGAMPQRVDRWSKATDGSDRWVLTSQPQIDTAPITQVFGADGVREQRVDADGTITERIEPKRLLDIWKSKGLPTS